MKLFCALVFIYLLALFNDSSGMTINSEYWPQFLAFVDHFHKTYPNDEAEAIAFGYYVENLKFITEWNISQGDEYGDYKFCLGLNWWSDMSPSERPHGGGNIPDYVSQ